ncbi:phytanoyl-CoA dioxygenase family protein [Paenibacillus mesophilus]|uniref:phytanoyl-CoA dioxygenase family protein n=1 Tax=Paenibacillus mesophilus TaxID=2582849 RepID=UPI0030827A65
MISQEDVEFYNENGYLLVKAVFDHQEIEAMRTAIDSIIQRAVEANMDRNSRWGGDHMPEAELKKVVLKGYHDVQYHDSAFTSAAVHPNMRRCCRG